MWNCSSKGLRAYKESAVEFPALTVTVLALPSRTCFNENKYSLFTDYISRTVVWVLAVRFHGVYVVWGSSLMRNQARFLTWPYVKVGMLSRAIGVPMIWGGTANILNIWIFRKTQLISRHWNVLDFSTSTFLCWKAEPDLLSPFAFELHFSSQWLFLVPLSLWFSLTVFLLIYLIIVL